MKIAHISDLHIDKNYKRNNFYKTLRLFEYIASHNYDHIIISGDITENAEDSAFEITRTLLKRYGWLDSGKLTLTIGNHDIFGGVHLAEDVMNFPKKCRLTDYDAKVNTFEKYFEETFRKTLKSPNGLFPFIKEFDEFVLISLNSIARYSILKNPFASNGEISAEQMETLNDIINKNDFYGKKKIAIAHHHFMEGYRQADNEAARQKKYHETVQQTGY
jgi:Icc protein